MSAFAGVAAGVGFALGAATLLAATLVRAGPATLPAAADYGHGWLFGSAVAAVGAVYLVGRRAGTARPAVACLSAFPKLRQVKK